MNISRSKSETEKLGSIIRAARLRNGLTKQDLAHLAGTNINSVGRAERDVLDVKWSTLQKIVEIGLGGELELKLKL